MTRLKRVEKFDDLSMGKGLYLEVSREGKRGAVISCPGCGGISGLPGWKIAPDGSVTPSVDHTQSEQGVNGKAVICTFHDMVFLEDWKQ